MPSTCGNLSVSGRIHASMVSTPVVAGLRALRVTPHQLETEARVQQVQHGRPRGSNMYPGKEPGVAAAQAQLSRTTATNTATWRAVRPAAVVLVPAGLQAILRWSRPHAGAGSPRSRTSV